MNSAVCVQAQRLARHHGPDGALARVASLMRSCPENARFWQSVAEYLHSEVGARFQMHRPYQPPVIVTGDEAPGMWVFKYGNQKMALSVHQVKMIEEERTSEDVRYRIHSVDGELDG